MDWCHIVFEYLKNPMREDADKDAIKMRTASRFKYFDLILLFLGLATLEMLGHFLIGPR